MLSLSLLRSFRFSLAFFCSFLLFVLFHHDHYQLCALFPFSRNCGAQFIPFKARIFLQTSSGIPVWRKSKHEHIDNRSCNILASLCLPFAHTHTHAPSFRTHPCDLLPFYQSVLHFCHRNASYSFIYFPPRFPLFACFLFTWVAVSKRLRDRFAFL